MTSSSDRPGISAKSISQIMPHDGITSFVILPAVASSSSKNVPLIQEKTTFRSTSAMRILSEIIKEVKQYWNGPLFVRISSTDYKDGGNTPETFVQYAEWMKADGVDLID